MGSVAAAGCVNVLDRVALVKSPNRRRSVTVRPVRVDVATPLDPSDRDSPVALYIGIGQAF